MFWAFIEGLVLFDMSASAVCHNKYCWHNWLNKMNFEVYCLSWTESHLIKQHQQAAICTIAPRLLWYDIGVIRSLMAHVVTYVSSHTSVLLGAPLTFAQSDSCGYPYSQHVTKAARKKLWRERTVSAIFLLVSRVLTETLFYCQQSTKTKYLPTLLSHLYAPVSSFCNAALANWRKLSLLSWFQG